MALEHCSPLLVCERAHPKGEFRAVKSDEKSPGSERFLFRGRQRALALGLVPGLNAYGYSRIREKLLLKQVRNVSRLGVLSMARRFFAMPTLVGEEP